MVWCFRQPDSLARLFFLIHDCTEFWILNRTHSLNSQKTENIISALFWLPKSVLPTPNQSLKITYHQVLDSMEHSKIYGKHDPALN